jgi:CheY-like chemotaxis protein
MRRKWAAENESGQEAEFENSPIHAVILVRPYFGRIRESVKILRCEFMSLEATFSIIVVEDDAELQKVITELLERAGYEVFCAEDPNGALEILRAARRPCIVLWDPMTARVSLSVLAESALRGVHVATLPIGLAIAHADDGGEATVTKRLTSPAAVLSIVREHCPQRKKPAA